MGHHGGQTLRKYIEELLRKGKRSADEEFQLLFRVFKEERVRTMVEEIKREWKEGKK